MRRIRWITVTFASTLVVVVNGCGRNSAPAADDALKSDLALAAQAQPSAMQPLSPNESNLTSQPQLASRAPLSTARRAAPVRRSPARRSSSSSAGNYPSSSSSGGYYPASTPAPPTTIEKNTERDAAIGAVAGAVLGATSSRNKVRGGLIGAAIGGVLGGVIGNNVDVKKKTGW